LIRLMNVADVYNPVNLGNPGEFTIKELAEEVVKICGSTSGVKYLPLPPDDPRQRKPDISRAQTLLDWNPTIPLNEGLKKTVAYFKQRIDSEQ
jgi:UDP-glucuronate decarboxylase